MESGYWAPCLEAFSVNFLTLLKCSFDFAPSTGTSLNCLHHLLTLLKLPFNLITQANTSPQLSQSWLECHFKKPPIHPPDSAFTSTCLLNCLLWLKSSSSTKGLPSSPHPQLSTSIIPGQPPTPNFYLSFWGNYLFLTLTCLLLMLHLITLMWHMLT